MITLNYKEIKQCIRCGTCCSKGGPVLHIEDKTVLLEGYAGHHHLMTIRKGEMVYNPIKEKHEIALDELIKVKGKATDWTCLFYDEKNLACSIYEHRFIECRLLKCWDTSEIISIIGKNTLKRSDIINKGDPILEIIEIHEKECSYQEIELLISKLSNRAEKLKTIEKLSEIARKDLAIRYQAMNDLGMDKKFELFIFGRPLIKVLDDRGLHIHI